MPAALPYKGKGNESRPADDGAALRGATLAFGAKPTVKPKPVVKNYSGTNGALAAAMKVGTHLQPPQSQRPNSDSHIAANLAASRSSSISPMHTGQRSQISNPGYSSHYSPNRPRSPSASSIASNAREYRKTQEVLEDVKDGRQRRKPQVEQAPKPAEHHNQTLDTTPIPSTNKLISIFEDKSPPRDTTARPVPKPPSLQMKNQNKGPSGQIGGSQGEDEPRSLAVRPTIKSPKPCSYKVPAPAPKLRRRSSIRARQRNSGAYDKTQDDSSSSDSFVSASDFKENEIQRAAISPRSIQKPKPKPPPPRGRIKRDLPSEDRGRRQSVDAMEFDGTFRPIVRTKSAAPIENGLRRSSVPEMEYHGAFIPHLTGNSLANAVVASSLASTRTGSPNGNNSKHLLIHQQRLQDSRTPSPAKGLRKTMRNPAKENEDDEQLERRGKKKLLNKHPNKHAEGDRKRWRDEITERERKRYEAVWASNKGLFLPSPSDSTSNTNMSSAGLSNPPNNPNLTTNDINANPTTTADLVSNIVVRDIWQRSRLGSDVLEEVWDLVNRSQASALTREEFVVGLWLIDQRLKGRKLPMRVSDSLWGSASRVRVIPPKRKR